MPMTANRLLPAFLILPFLLLTGSLAADSESFSAGESALMPLSEVERGMRGEWRTVVSGTEVETFELEVLGVMENFIGPRRSVIICKAITPSQITSGPVSGMSGSPVYIEGRLVGAYAYGYTWPKEQAIIGVTPIDQMLEVLEYPVDEEAFNRGRQGDGARVASTGEMLEFAPDFVARAGLPSVAQLRPLPTPLMASGVTPQVLAAFADEFERLGVEVMAAPMGTAEGGEGSGLTIDDVQPGSAVAGVLMQGDFNFAATGTVTWREGDRLLAFGHPFMQSGPVAMPMAPAEVLTVVQSVPSSFKMSRVGPILGSIYQDRLTAVAGELGRYSPMSDVTITVKPETGAPTTFAAEMFHSEDFSPLLAAISLLQSLSSTMETEQRQTVYLKSSLKLDGFDTVEWESVTSGPGSGMSSAVGILRELGSLMRNPFQVPTIEKLDLEVQLRNEWSLTRIRELQILSGTHKPGGEVRVAVTLQNFLGAPERHEMRVPLPESLRTGDTVTVFIGDAQSADALDQGAGSARADFDSLDDWVTHLRARRANDALYVKLLVNRPGLRVDGHTLPSLPATARTLMADPRSQEPMLAATQVTLWEDAVPLSSLFNGAQRLDFVIE
ncbi:MAG: hypothetical protein ACFB20_11220 [Opitutales bacterium]